MSSLRSCGPPLLPSGLGGARPSGRWSSSRLWPHPSHQSAGRSPVRLTGTSCPFSGRWGVFRSPAPSSRRRELVCCTWPPSLGHPEDPWRCLCLLLVASVSPNSPAAFRGTRPPIGVGWWRRPPAPSGTPSHAGAAYADDPLSAHRLLHRPLLCRPPRPRSLCEGSEKKAGLGVCSVCLVVVAWNPS